MYKTQHLIVQYLIAVINLDANKNILEFVGQSFLKELHLSGKNWRIYKEFYDSDSMS